MCVMKSMTCAAAGRWMLFGVTVVGAFAGNAHAAVAERADRTSRADVIVAVATSPPPCSDTIGTAKIETVATTADAPSCVAGPGQAQGGATGDTNLSGALPASGNDSTFGIAVGAALVVAGSATSLLARRRRT
jgi:LPXTG-motif cell wall-anchored protein